MPWGLLRAMRQDLDREFQIMSLRQLFAMLATAGVCSFSASMCNAAAVTVVFDNNIFQDSSSDEVTVKLLTASGSSTRNVLAGRF
jgi:hypothetical protein